MIQVKSKALNKTVSVDRVIHKIEGKEKGPTVVFFGGIHGNEPAGIFALQEVLVTVDRENVRGTIYALSGNLAALEKEQRFLDIDLNRIWTKNKLLSAKYKTDHNNEEHQQKVLYDIIWKILDDHPGPFYFIDLHTTSSETPPFITINDALINRRFSKLFPIPIVLGIEEYLSGPLLSYINELGYVSLGFEAGQHNEEQAIRNNVAFINLVLAHSNVIDREQIINFEQQYQQLLAGANHSKDLYEVIQLHTILNGDEFEMKPGFKSFQNIKKGEEIARSNNDVLTSEYDAKIFMPLYQAKGQEGFFVIQKIKPLFVRLSSLLRSLRFDGLLIILPGITWQNRQLGVLRVNLTTAKYLAKPIFHLLGYRNRQADDTHILLYNRERVAKTKMYKKEFWYKKNV